MNVKHEKTIERIKKLLALATSSNEHEAKLAAEQASRLLVKHNLTASEVQSDREYCEATLDHGTRASVEDKFINMILTRFFFVDMISIRLRWPVKRIQYQIIGERHNVEIAKYVREFLYAAFDRLWRDYKASTGASVRAKQAYFFGLYQGLSDQLSAAQKSVEDETGLVVVKDPGIAEYLRKLHEGSRFTTRSHGPIQSDAAAEAAGNEAGRNLKIARGIHEGTGASAGGMPLALKGR